VAPLETTFDFQNRRAVVVEGHEDAVMTFTSVADLAAGVALAVGHEGEWPEVSGIRGNRVAVSRVIEIGEKIRGKSPQHSALDSMSWFSTLLTLILGPFRVDKVALDDLEQGILNTSWMVSKKHKAVSDDEASGLFKVVTIGMLLSSVKGAWDVSDEVNQLFPDYQFDDIEAFLTRVWNQKP
jgi:hypothetical protein